MASGRFDVVLHPFGKGSLTTDGVQYSAEVTGITNAAYTAIETVNIENGFPHKVEEMEFGLTMAINSNSTTQAVLWKFQGSDDNSAWADLIAEQIRAASAVAYADVTVLGRWTPVTNFNMNKDNMYLRGVVKSNTYLDTNIEVAAGKMKNSSYIAIVYKG